MAAHALPSARERLWDALGVEAPCADRCCSGPFPACSPGALESGRLAGGRLCRNSC